MNFDLDDDERALQGAIRDLCKGRVPLEHPRAAASPGGVDRDNWAALGEAGVFSLRLPEDRGGVGLGITQAVLVFEELGRALVPGPLAATHLAAGLVDGAATGERIVGVMERGARPSLVEHLEALDVLLVLDDDGLWSVAPGEIAAEEVAEPLDPLTPLHRVGSLPGGELVAGPEEASRWRLEGAALTAALCLGIAEGATDAAVAYAKERHQFGRPIGSFQAVKHLCADMLVRTEVARAAVYAAGVSLDGGGGAAPARAVAGAAVLASEAAFVNGKDCIQVYGGMGFTWEAGVHLSAKRAALLATHFGPPDGHLATIAGTL